MKDEKIRIVGYCRESTMMQFEQGFNIDDQEKKIRQYVDIYYPDGNYILEVYKEGASAKSLNRPEMKKIIAMGKKKQFDVLIVHNLDRMTRRVKDLAQMLELMQENSIQLVSITEKIDTDTPMGRFFIYLIVLIAQWEQDTIRARSLRGTLESARQGNYSKPGVPYGYQRDPNDKHKLVVNNEQAEIIRWLFKTAAEEDNSIDRLAVLIKQRFPDDYLQKHRIRKLLSNKLYYGIMEIQGEEIANVVPPLVSEDEYRKANGIHHKRERVPRRYYFSKYVYCKECQSRAYGNVVKSGKNENLYYRCEVCDKNFSQKKIVHSLEHILNKEEMHLILRSEPSRRTFLRENISRIEVSNKDGSVQITRKTVV